MALSSSYSETDATSSLMSLSLSDTPSSSSSPPSICPHCLNNINLPPRKGSQLHPGNIPNSHTDFETFKSEVNAGLKGQHECVGCDEAKVLLLNWKDNDLALHKPEKGSLIIDETRSLEYFLRDTYRYHTQYFEIPSYSPFESIQNLLSATILDLSNQKRIEKKRVLLIVYHNEHAAVRDGKLIWSAKKDRVIGQDNHPKFPVLSWYGLQPRLEEAEFDVLLILDCCNAAGAVTKGGSGTMEVLASSSREVISAGPGGGISIGSPFTHVLVKHLQEPEKHPHGLLLKELHASMSLDPVLNKQSPNHVTISGAWDPIILKPIRSKEELQKTETLLFPTANPEIKALVAIRFRGEVLPDVEDFVRWLNSQYPQEIHQVELEKVSVEGFFDSCSTLTLLSMPISLWANLPKLSSSSLVGFVKSRNRVVGIYQDAILGLETAMGNTEFLEASSEKGAPSVTDSVFYSSSSVRDLDEALSQITAPDDTNFEFFAFAIPVDKLHFLSRSRNNRWSVGILEVDGAQTRDVLVEWGPLNATVSDDVRRRALINFLGYAKTIESLRFLEFLGFVNRPVSNAFDIVLARPSLPNESYLNPISLQEALQLSETGRKWKPTLEDRLALAYTLAVAVLRLHDNGYLHKNFSSSNVLFFSSETNSVSSWRHPYIIGLSLDYQLNSETRDYYRHPEYHRTPGTRYTPEFDYYSLGIVLLEIGLWMPLNIVVRKYERFSSAEMRTFLLDRVVPQLKYTMGTRYFHAVGKFLRGDWKSGINVDREFRKVVVEELSLGIF